jgi:hypothetical protein
MLMLILVKEWVNFTYWVIFNHFNKILIELIAFWVWFSLLAQIVQVHY